jgi:putative addiction module killer protein
VIAAIEVLHYQTSDGRIPIREWLDSVTDPIAYAAIQIRQDRLARGLFGDCKPVGEGVWELRIDTGAGYRVYYAHSGKRTVLLLCGGDKRKQKADIKTAKAYWRDYEQRTHPRGRSR